MNLVAEPSCAPTYFSISASIMLATLCRVGFVYDSCMATKTISIEIDVYDKLRRLKETPGESFSQVLRRVLAAPKVVTGADIVKLIKEGSIPKLLSDEELDHLEAEQQRELDVARAQSERKAG